MRIQNRNKYQKQNRYLAKRYVIVVFVWIILLPIGFVGTQKCVFVENRQYIAQSTKELL